MVIGSVVVVYKTIFVFVESVLLEWSSIVMQEGRPIFS